MPVQAQRGSGGVIPTHSQPGTRKRCSKPRSGCFSPVKDLIPIVQEAKWTSSPVWTARKIASHWDSIPGQSILQRITIPTILSWLQNVSKGKGKIYPRRSHEGPEEEQRCSSTLSLTSTLGGWSKPRLGRFTLGKDPVPIVQEAGWAPGPVWTGVKNLALTGIQCPDRPAHSQSLYR